MSYKGYNNSNSYSPYFQQNTGQNGRGQYQEQAVNTSAYQSHSYQPLSAYQSHQQHTQSSTPQSVSASTYGNHDYRNVNTSAGTSAQDSRGGYPNSGRSVDTSALGDLAYASSLGRGNPSLRQMIDHNRTQNTASYGNSNSYGMSSAAPLQYGTGNGRADSRGSSREEHTASTQQATSGPSYSHTSSNASSGHQGQPTGARVYGQGQAQHTSSQGSRASALNKYTSQPPRPTSGQAVQHPHPRASSQSLQSPTIRANQAVSNQQRRGSGVVRGSEQTRVQSPLQQVHQNSAVPNQASHAQEASAANRSQSDAQRSLTAASYGQIGPSKNTQQPPAVANGESSRTSTPLSSQYPATVDPSQVFNHHAYSRRQAEAETERKKVAEAAQAVAQSKATTTKETNGTGSASAVALSIELDAETAKKNQMELEMKQMIEKMREYKSKDPSLFSQIWEQVKKGQPPQQPPSQPAAQGLSPSSVVVNGQLGSPSIAQAQLPPEFELPPAQSEDFDKGRFPAQRRRRGGKKDTPSRETATPVNIQRSSAHSVTASTPTSYVSRSGSAVPDHRTEAMKNAMQDFNRNTSSPMPQSKAASATTTTKTLQQNTSSPTSIPAPNAQNSQQPPKSGRTYWPENKKRALAEAARSALTSALPNIGKQITTDELHKLLDQNPSYTQLCEILEYRGFVIDRGHFARLLLSAVPDLGASNNASTKPKPPAVGPPPPSSTAPPPPPPHDSAPQHAPFSVPPRPPNNVSTTSYTAATVGPYPQQIGRSYHLVDPAHRARISRPKTAQDGKVPQGQPDRPRDSTLGDGDSSVTAISQNGVNWADKGNLTSASVDRFVDDNGKIDRPLYVNDLKRPWNSIPKPPTKQEMARKRNFGDIVDLTQLSDNEPRPQRPRLENPESLPPTLDNAQFFWPGVPSTMEMITQKQAKVPSVGMNKANYKLSGREHLWNEEVVRPMNKRQDALRRSSYDPKTIARDILLALGKHPTMQPLNAYLDVLRDKFQSVNYDSDLSTFRWDLVDPGGDPAPVTAPVLVDGDANDADDEDVDVPNSSLMNRHRPRTSVVIGAGPGGTSAVTPGMGSAISPAKDTSFRCPRGRPSNRGTPSRGGHIGAAVRSRTDAFGPSNQPQVTPSSQQQDMAGQQGTISQQPNSYRGSDNLQASSSSQGLSRFMYNAPFSMNAPSVVSGVQLPPFDSSQFRTAASLTPQPTTPSTNSGSDKRKGRPPGAKNKKPRPDKGIPKQRPSDQGLRNSDLSVPTRPRINLNTSTPARPSGLRNAMTPTGSISGSTDHRNAMSPMDGIAVVIPSRSPSIANTPNAKSSKTGRPRKMPVPSGRYPSQPSFKVYKCLWESCPAELHNLETLKKHVRKHRDKFEKTPFPCLWADCYDSNLSVANKSQDGNSSERERQRLSFGSAADWEKHMEKEHVNVIAWELGDGPTTHSSDYDSSEYMGDSRSRQPTQKITPSSRQITVPTSMSPPPRPSQNNGKVRAESTELERAQAQIEAHGRNFRANLFF